MNDLLCAVPVELWHWHILNRFTCLERRLNIAPVCSYLRSLVGAMHDCQCPPTLPDTAQSLQPACETKLEFSLWQASAARHPECRRRALGKGARWNRAMILRVCALDDLELFSAVVEDTRSNMNASQLGQCVAEGGGVACAKAFESLSGSHLLECAGVLQTAVRRRNDEFLEHVLQPDMLPVGMATRRRRSVEEQLALSGGLKWLRLLEDIGHTLDHQAILCQALSCGDLDIAAYAYAGTGRANNSVTLLW